MAIFPIKLILPMNVKLPELKGRLLEINDLSAADALLSWDHATRVGRPDRRPQPGELEGDADIQAGDLHREASPEVEPRFARGLDAGPRAQRNPTMCGCGYVADERNVARQIDCGLADRLARRAARWRDLLYAP